MVVLCGYVKVRIIRVITISATFVMKIKSDMTIKTVVMRRVLRRVTDIKLEHIDNDMLIIWTFVI